ncbi:MAG TPA: CAP domain-containing protein [Thermoanaerobaculia bacterium]
MRSTLLIPLLLALPLAISLGAEGDPRGEVLRLLNAERQRVGAPPLRLSPELTRAAQAHADEIAARGSLKLRAGSTEAMRERLKRAGYQAHAWTESLTSGSGDPQAVLREVRQGDPESWRRLLAPESRDLGVGIDRVGSAPLYALLVAEPSADWFARGTAGLRDLGRVRAAILAAVDAERKKAGVPPLRANDRLDQAAQRHAQDMLARHYFAHESPEGETVRERARAAGYDWRAIGENIAEGQLSVDEVMSTWMHSPPHRKNILDPDYRELGVGLALGRSGNEWQVEWVQTFGTRR